MLNDYKYAIGTTKQVGDYNKITNYLILHIRKTYEHGSEYGSNEVWLIHQEDGRRLSTGQENVYPIHIKDEQHIQSIHKYNQA